MRRLVLLLAIVLLALPSRVLAQDTALSLEVTEDPGTHPDEGLMIAGGTVFLLGALTGLAVLMPLELAGCVEPGTDTDLPPDHGYASCSQAPLAAVPFAHLAAGGISSLIAGPILLVAEVIGLFTFVGGAAHHHPNAPRAGEVRLVGVAGAEAGLGLAVHF